RNVDNDTEALQTHNRNHVLAGHDRAAQVNRADAVEGFLSQLVERLVTTPDADPDIVVQDIDAAPTRPPRVYGSGEPLFLGYVGGEGYASAAFLPRHHGCFLGGGDEPVDRQDPGAFLREAEGRCTTIPESFAGTLAGSDDDGDLPFETHRGTPRICVRGCLA